MPLVASSFGGPYGLLFGCLALIVMHLLGLVWFALLAKSLLQGDRVSWLSLGVIVCFAFIPVMVIVASWRELNTLGSYGKSLFYLAIFGLVLLPLSFGHDFLKYRRDRPRRRPRPPPRPARSVDEGWTRRYC